MKKEQEEALLRIPIAILGWIIMDLWAALIVITSIINIVIALVTGNRNKELSEFSNYFVTYMFNFVRYASLTTNKRPFPWNDFGKHIEKVNMKKNS